ncbi:MAG: cyanophycin synthetase [Kofleriaceae bacterium]
MALLAFSRARPDLTVLEVGLGGRLDATNVVAAEVAVVTGVALDHEAMLGSTLRAIAGEKAGIFKRGQHVILGAAGEPEAVPWLRGAAQAVGAADIVEIDAAAIAAVPTLGLLGVHQRANAAAAIAAAVAAGVPVDVAALAGVRHPGRLEQVAGAPTVILDGAHNPHGARALAAAMATMPRPRVLVLGVSADKDAAAIAAPLVAEAEQVIATRYQQERALPPPALAAVVGPRATVAGDVAAALAAARATAPPPATIVIAGSLLLVGEARALRVPGAHDPLAVSDPAPPAPEVA